MAQSTILDSTGATVTVARVTNTGSAAPEDSLPTVSANDVSLTGPDGLSAINTDLLTGVVSGWLDTQAFQNAAIQIVASAGISAGAIIFEQTNDTTLAAAGVSLRAVEMSSISANPHIVAITIAASTNRLFSVLADARYIRVRISTAFVGGTVQAVATFSQRTTAFSVTNVQQATAASLNATAILAAGTAAVGDVGLQYRATAAGAASIRHFVSAASTNATSVKATAGRVVGWNLANTTASWKYVKLHNTAAAPTAGTGVVQTIPIPPNGLNVKSLGGGVGYSTGIGVTIVGGSADADATAVAVGDVVGDIFFA